MKRARWCAVIFLISAISTLAMAQTRICIGAVSGGDSVTWNTQQPYLQAIMTEAKSRGVPVTTQLLMSNNEKSARSEISSYKCDYALMTNVGREWPQPKASSGINGGGGGGAKDDAPHPSSTARFHHVLLDKSGKKIDKWDASIEMPMSATAKDVQPELQELIQEVANRVLDETTVQQH